MQTIMVAAAITSVKVKSEKADIALEKLQTYMTICIMPLNERLKCLIRLLKALLSRRRLSSLNTSVLAKARVQSIRVVRRSLLLCLCLQRKKENSHFKT